MSCRARKVSERGRDLSGFPKVGPGQPAGDFARCNPVNFNGNVLSKPELSGLDFVDGLCPNGEFARSCELPELGPVDNERFYHGEKVDLLSPSVKSHLPIHFISPEETRWMTDKKWEKRSWFLQWVEDARVMLKASGGKGTYVEVALLMDLAPNSMKKYTSEEWTGARPGPDALRRLGDYLGRDYRILYDGPDTPPAGIDPTAWAAASETRKLFAITMFHKSESFLPEHFKEFNRLIDSGVVLQRARKARS